MKVLLLTDEMLPGGVPRHVVDLANGLYKNGISVTVAATNGIFRERLNREIKFIELSLLKLNSYGQNYYGIIRSMICIWSLLRFEKYDIIHSHKRISHIIVKILNLESKHITSYHNYFQNKKIVTCFGDYTISVSESIRRQMISYYGCHSKMITTVYNGIASFENYNEQQRNNTFTRLEISPQKKIISSVGQYISSKDRHTLIMAVYILKKNKDLSQIQIVLLGYGELEKELKELTKSLQLNDIITFVEGTFDVEALFNISEFMILNPIHSEGFGIVMLEAASLGKMHIGTKVGGIPEFIEDGITGKLIEPGNPDQLAQTISFLLDNPNEYKRMGNNAKIKYEKLFGLNRMINETINVYHSVLSK
jgi:glycosyltransferase involved in cell wall biosynthesis